MNRKQKNEKINMFDSMKIKMKTKKQLKQNEHVWQNIDMKMQMKNNETGIQMKKKIKRTQKNLQKRPLPLTLRSFPAYWKMAMSYLTSRGLREHMVSLLLKLANNRTMKKLKTEIHMKKKTKKWKPKSKWYIINRKSNISFWWKQELSKIWKSLKFSPK